MTATAPNSISTGSNLNFCLDNFPPPRPSASAAQSSFIAREPTMSTRPFTSSTTGSPSLQMASPSRSRCGLPTNPRSPCSPRSLEKGVRRFASPHPRSGLRCALSSIFLHKSEPDLHIPIQDVSPSGSTVHEDVHLSPWPPLHIEKRPVREMCPGSCHCADPKRKKRRRLFLILLIILLLYLLGNTIFLNVRVLSPSRVTLYGRGDEGYTLSPEQELCLTQFTVTAPGNAAQYPCSTCLGFLQDIPPSFKFSTANGAQTYSNGLQFCGLQSLLPASSATAQSALTNGGWVQDTQFCTWSGVTCNGQGDVSSLQMVFPAVPSVIPAGISALSNLQSLLIVGGSNSPAGALPDSFANLTTLNALHLENTALSSLPTSLFSKGKLDNLTSLTLVRNSGFAGQFPDISGLTLETLVVDNQLISTPLSTLLNSTTVQGSLTTLSLTSTNLTGSFPSDSSTSGSSFFPFLQTLSLTNNSALSGPLPESLCGSSALASCDLRGTDLMGPSGGGDGSCGVCTFT